MQENENQLNIFGFSFTMRFRARQSERHLPEEDESIQVLACRVWWSCLMWGVMAEGRTGVALFKKRGVKKKKKCQLFNRN